jgi:hypothetical protein
VEIAKPAVAVEPESPAAPAVDELPPKAEAKQLTPEEVRAAVNAQIDASDMPANAKAWLKRHPEYVADPARRDQIVRMHETAKYLSEGEEFTDRYFTRMEEVLGLRQKPVSPTPAPSPRPVQASPSVQTRAQYAGPPPSAPPTRGAPMMSGNRPDAPIHLTQEQKEIAMQSALPGMSAQDAERAYIEGLKKMNALKAAGAIQS